MKITLISTSTYPSDQGIRTISSVLKKAGHEVKLIFMSLSEDYSVNYSKDELNQLAKLCKQSSLIGINSFASTSERAKKIVSFLKKNFQIPIVYGGVHATISPEDCIKISDIVCVGEGEEAILELANAIEKKKSINKIKNLWIKKENKIIKNPLRNIIENLDKIPIPDYEIKTHYLLEAGTLRKFRETDLDGAIFFLTGRGCPYGCDYCSNSFMNKLYKGKCKKIVRWHSPEYIINGILEMKKRLPSLNYFDIRDDTFSLRPIKDIKKFCDLYKQKIKLRFKCLGDPKTISDEKIKLLVDAGCTDIIIGIQGSEKTNTELYHRNQKDEHVLRAAKILNKYKNKLAVMYDVITCNPYEPKENIISLIKLLLKIPRPYYLSVNNLVFFPGSQLYRQAINDEKIKPLLEKSAKLNYWDRAKHIKLKNQNAYLVLILNLMRGSATDKRFGFMPVSLIKKLIQPEKVNKNLKNNFKTNLVLKLVELSDFFRENLFKKIYRSLPVGFKVWYDNVRYRV